MRKSLTLALALLILGLALVAPPLRGTKVIAQTQTRTIILNTGYDQWLQPAPAPIGLGQKDNEWRVIRDTAHGVFQDPAIATGRPADVVSATSWETATAHFSADTRWISVTPTQGMPLSGPFNEFQYAYYFTLPVGFSNPVLMMQLSADDVITKVTLNSATPNGVTLFQGVGGAFNDPNGPLVLDTSTLTPANFNSGSIVNVITVDVADTGAVKTGLIVDGTVTYQDCDRLPVKDIPGLNSITFWESTFAAPTQHTFAATGPELTTRLNPLDSSNNDFVGVPDLEFYDVFYSNWDGTFSPTGSFVTIEAAVPTIGYPSGGGLNIARVDFNGTGQFANSVSSFVCLGNNALPVKVGKAVDFDPGVPQTDTTMGNTIGQTQRLRLTVGFPCCTPPPPNMVAWWPLDEVSGATSFQDIIGGNNATPFASPVGAAQAPQSVSGVVNGAINFPKFGNGLSGARVAPLGALATIGSSEFTIDAWVEFPSEPAGRLHYIVNKFDPQQNKGYALYVVSPGIAGNDRLEFQWGDGTTVSTVQSIPPPLTPNQWHHVAVTFARNVGGNPVDIRLYVDGSQQGQQVGGNPGLGSLVNFDSLEIGWQPSAIDEPITLDELEIFSRPLSASEIQVVFNAGTAGKCKPCATPPPDMVAWWPADGNANDITPNPDNGTLKGGATFAPGMVAQAFSLNGMTAYVSAPPAPKIDFGTGDFSIDAWIKTTNANGVQIIVDKRVGKNGTTFTGYSLFTFNGNLAVQLANGTATNFISATNVADGAFHHVAVTVVRNSATGGMLYVGGMPVYPFDPTARQGSLTNIAELRIGRNCPNTVLDTFFNGLIDEVELFNRALSVGEVQSIFLAGSRGKCKGCIITCPSNITQSTDLNQCGAVVTYAAPTPAQSCSVVCSPPSGSFFPKGTTTVNCSTSAGPSCTFTVTVNDTQPPTISASGVVVLIGPGTHCAPAYFGVTASDNCPGVTKTCSPASGSCFPIGTTTVTCTATDSSGNTATTSFTVTIPNPFDIH